MKKWVLKPQIVFVLAIAASGFWLFSASSNSAATFNFRAFGSKGVG